MPPSQQPTDKEDVEVLVTGFGPFGRFEVNPSWLCTRALHDTYIALDDAAPSPSQGNRRRAHIQVVQTSVSYEHILDMVPRIHGTTPSAPEARVYHDPSGDTLGGQGDGKHFPQGYRSLHIPAKGYFDLVIHVGVGYPDNVAVETTSHKRGYQLADVQKHRAPVATDQSATTRREAVPSAAELRERENMQQQSAPMPKDDPVRGFGVGYEPFDDELSTSNDVKGLVRWLTQHRKHQHVRQSLDAGRFLCDYIFYCSLAEAQRTQHKTRVQFVHVPPVGVPYSSEECQAIVQDIIWWLASKQS